MVYEIIYRIFLTYFSLLNTAGGTWFRIWRLVCELHVCSSSFRKKIQLLHLIFKREHNCIQKKIKYLWSNSCSTIGIKNTLLFTISHNFNLCFYRDEEEVEEGN